MGAPAQKPPAPAPAPAPAKPATASPPRPVAAVPAPPRPGAPAPAATAKPPTPAGTKPPTPAAPVGAKPGAPAAAAKPGAPAAASQNPSSRKLKKGEILFNEGETSKAMYFIKSGMIRVFKKKGDSSIEIDTIHAGQVIGELAFLDGNPRSASAEALTEVEISEVSGPTFQAVLTKMPDWLKILLKAVVGRLRTASTRIRQLEQATTSFDYDKDGKRGQSYTYLSPHDSLKVASAILLVASKNGTKSENGLEVKMPILNRYAYNIMGVPTAKITTFIDLLNQNEIVLAKDADLASHIHLREPDLLERYIAYQNDENQVEPSKRHDINVRSMMIMGLIAKHLPKFPADPATGLAKVNIADIKAKETANGKEPFRLDEFGELIKLGYCTELNTLSATEITTQVKAESFSTNFRFQKIIHGLKAINESKR